jgi:hypothetical protein
VDFIDSGITVKTTILVGGVGSPSRKFEDGVWSALSLWEALLLACLRPSKESLMPWLHGDLFAIWGPFLRATQLFASGLSFPCLVGTVLLPPFVAWHSQVPLLLGEGGSPPWPCLSAYTVQDTHLSWKWGLKSDDPGRSWTLRFRVCVGRTIIKPLCPFSLWQNGVSGNRSVPSGFKP